MAQSVVGGCCRRARFLLAMADSQTLHFMAEVNRRMEAEIAPFVAVFSIYKRRRLERWDTQLFYCLSLNLLCCPLDIVRSLSSAPLSIFNISPPAKNEGNHVVSGISLARSLASSIGRRP